MDTKEVTFLVRTLSPDYKVRYKISLMNRFDDQNFLSFEGTTVAFNDFGHILDCKDGDKSKCFTIPLQVLTDFVFYNEEDDDRYFSLIVEFKV
jgi:hypothetical protein